MDNVFDQIFKALEYLFISYTTWYIWKISFDSATGGKLKKTLWKGFLYCGIIALLTSISLGSPTCEVRSDPLYGGCEEYADDGFIPTKDQKIGNFAFTVTLLYIPVVVGALYGNKREKTKQ